MTCLSRFVLAALVSAALSSQALAADAPPADAKPAAPAKAAAAPADDSTPLFINPERIGSPEAEKISTKEPLSRFLWLNVGYYGPHHSDYACGNDVGCSATDSSFGLNMGAAFAIARLGEGFHFSLFGNLAAAFGDLDYYPVTVGVGFAYDRLPLHLFGGAGFSIVPHTSNFITPQDNNIALGGDIFLMALYPLPDVAKHFGVQAQLQFDILDESLFIWSLTAGIAYSF